MSELERLRQHLVEPKTGACMVCRGSDHTCPVRRVPCDGGCAGTSAEPSDGHHYPRHDDPDGPCACGARYKPGELCHVCKSPLTEHAGPCDGY